MKSTEPSEQLELFSEKGTFWTKASEKNRQRVVKGMSDTWDQIRANREDGLGDDPYGEIYPSRPRRSKKG